MEYIKVTRENLEREHICCAISNNNDVQVASKKAWLAERFDDGLVFLKSVERGKCFIEYIPAEMAWNPLLADGYMYIDCLWVSGSLRDTVTRTTCWENASGTAGARGRRACASCPPRRNCPSWPTPNT